MKKISRREFLNGAGALGAVAALNMFGMSSASAEGTEKRQGVPESWDHEADVVVVGFGAAGIGAAIQAADAGDEVLILEKMNEEFAGGDTGCNDGHFFAMYDFFLTDSAVGEMSEEVAKARADASLEAFQMALAAGMPMEENGMTVVGRAVTMYQVLKGMALERPVKVMYETPVTELIYDPIAKEVLGVFAEQNGKKLAIKARKGVVLACGDYSANRDLVHKMHYPKLVYFCEGSPANTGDGMIMAAKVGAQVKRVANLDFDWACFCLRKPSEEIGTSITRKWWSAFDSITPGANSSPMHDSFIYVNMQGERFINEEERLEHEKRQLPITQTGLLNPTNWLNGDYANLPAFMVLDQACFESARIADTAADIDTASYGWNGAHKLYRWSDDNSVELEKGWILKGDTIEELASKMTAITYMREQELTVPADALQAAIDKYNAGLEAGVDEFGRTERAKPIGKGPYYAVEIAPSVLYALGSLESDINGNVLDWDDKPISRLYCAGNIGQGLHIMPLGVAACMGCGFICGRSASKLEPWE